MRWYVFGVCSLLASLAIIVGIFNAQRPDAPLATHSQIDNMSSVGVQLQPEGIGSVEVAVDTKLCNFHQRTLSAFENAMGFGRTRGGAHVFMADGETKMYSVTFDSKSSADNSNDSPFEPIGPWGDLGAWGKLGTRTAARNSSSSALGETATSTTATPAADTTPPKPYPFGFAYLAPSIVDPSFQFELLDVQLVAAKSQRVFLFDDKPDHVSILKNASLTREMNTTEALAYAKLAIGEDVVVSSSADELSMLGSLRNEYHCVSCHEEAEGSLLGAFSYRFRPK